MGYPGIALDERGDEVEGLLFSSDSLAEYWARLDEFEGEGYDRVLTTVKPKDGTAVDAYIYRLDGDNRHSAQRAAANIPLIQAANAISDEVLALVAGEVPAIEVGPGCRRRDLPSATGVRAWIVEMAPGSEWPHVDRHPTGEDVYVLEGEMIEGEQRYPAGSYLHFLPGSSHQPWTETGLRLFGFNVIGDTNG